jgi:hypothetical protein
MNEEEEEEAMAAGMVGSVGGGESIAVCFVVFEVSEWELLLHVWFSLTSRDTLFGKC